MFCDIERFKAVNDQHGHRAGDQLLVDVAERLQAAVGEDDVVARWGGGDEFLVITDSVNDWELARLADRITDELDRAPVALGGEGKQVAARMTIGFAAHRTGDGRSIDAVLEHADQAMYNKRRRRSRRAAGS